MASTPDIGDRNDMTLWASGVMLDDLLRRAADWDTRSDSEQLDFFLEWEELTDRLSGVAEDAEGGRLSASQRDRLSLLASRLSQARPIIERLGLDYPDLSRLSLAS